MPLDVLLGLTDDDPPLGDPAGLAREDHAPEQAHRFAFRVACRARAGERLLHQLESAIERGRLIQREREGVAGSGL